MRLIDADVLKPHEQLEPMGNGKYEYVGVVYMDDIDDAPTIDAVPVVRCSECKKQAYCHKTVAKTKRYVEFMEYYTEQIEWCSRGERREDGEA